MMNKVEMNENMMEQVNGGYWYDSYALNRAVYNKYGVRTDFRWFERDRFFLPGDVEVGEIAANNYVIQQIGQEEFDRLKECCPLE